MLEHVPGDPLGKVFRTSMLSICLIDSRAARVHALTFVNRIEASTATCLQPTPEITRRGKHRAAAPQGLLFNHLD